MGKKEKVIPQENKILISADVKAKVEYGLAGEYKVDVYDKGGALKSTTNWFSNYIPASGLEHPRKYPFAKCFEILSVGTSATQNNVGTTGLVAPLNSSNSQNTIPVEQYMGKRFWESGRKVGSTFFPGSCGTHFPCNGPIMFRGWRIPTGTGFAKATTTIKEFAVFPGTSGLENEKGNIGDSPWTNGVTPCFSRVTKKVAIQKDQFAIINYRLQVKMKHTGASIFAPTTIEVSGIHPDSADEISGLWGSLSGKFKQVVPAISYVTEFGKTKIPKWGDYLEPACTGYAKGGFWYLSPDKYQFIGANTGGPIFPDIPYTAALAGYYCNHIMIKDGDFPDDFPENKYPKGNARRGSKNQGIDVPNTGDYRGTHEVKYSESLFHVDDGAVTKEPYDMTQFGNVDRVRRQRIKAVWAANQGRGPKYRFRSMIFGGTEPKAGGGGGGEQDVYPNIDFMFSDDSGRYPSFRRDIGITGATLTHSGRNYAANKEWKLDEGRVIGNRRASVTNDQTLTDGATPIGNSGSAGILSGVGTIVTSQEYYGGSVMTEEFLGHYTDLKVLVTGGNYTGIPNIDTGVIPNNWSVLEVKGQNPDTGYFNLSGMHQCISGYITGSTKKGPWGAAFSSGAFLGAYVGTNGSDSSDYTAPSVLISGGTGIAGSSAAGADYSDIYPDVGGAPVTGAGTAVMQLYNMKWSGDAARAGHTGKVWGVVDVLFDQSPWRGRYKSTGYATHPDHDDMELEQHFTGCIPGIRFAGGSLLNGNTINAASGRLALTDNARASGTLATGENYQIKDMYVGGAATPNQVDGTSTSQGWWQHTGDNVSNYTKLGYYPYKDNLNILNLFLELNWSGQDSGCSSPGDTCAGDGN